MLWALHILDQSCVYMKEIDLFYPMTFLDLKQYLFGYIVRVLGLLKDKIILWGEIDYNPFNGDHPYRVQGI